MFYVVLRYRNGSKFGTFNFDTYDEALEYAKSVSDEFTVSLWSVGNSLKPMWERK